MSYQGAVKKPLFTNIIVFDLETGGFSPTKNPLIEIAAIVIDSNLNEIARYEAVILPYDDTLEYTVGALRANGFTMGEINKRGKESSIVAREIVEFMTVHQCTPTATTSYLPDKKPVLSGHNIDEFDIPFLEHFLKIHKYDLWKFVSRKMTLDTLKYARLFFGYQGYTGGNHTLGSCCQYIGYKIVDAHRAMNDVEANLQLLKYFMEGARGQNQRGVQSQEQDRFRDSFKL